MTKSLGVLMKQLAVTRNLLVTEDPDEIKVTQQMCDDISDMRHNQIEDI